jgi:hypothetical protein
MVFAVFVYVLIATVLAVKIGRPLVRLNFLNEQYNANYRYLLVRLLEYAESIAFYAGEKVEGMLLRSRFGQIIHNNWRIVFRSLKFQGFNLIVSQTAVVFPLIVQAHRFFSKQITLGDLMQTPRLWHPARQSVLLPQCLRRLCRLSRGAQPSVRLLRLHAGSRQPATPGHQPSGQAAGTGSLQPAQPGWRLPAGQCLAGNSGRQRAADSRPFRLGQNHAAAQPGRAVAL